MKWGCSEESGQPNDRSPPLLLWLFSWWGFLSHRFLHLSGSSLAPLEPGYFSSKSVWWGVCISNQAMRNTYIKPLVKHAAVLIHYFWCNHIYHFLVAQQKEHLWFHSPVVLTTWCEQEQGFLDVCCVQEGMEHYQRGARLFIPPARAKSTWQV